MTISGSPVSVAGWRWSAAARVWSVVLGVVVVALVVRAVLRPPIDLQVYAMGGSMVVSRGDDLYGASAVTGQGLPFTYPPFAAVLFVPPALAGLTVASVLLVLVSVGCLIRMCYLVVVRARLCAVYPVSVPTATVVAAVATMVAEPATTNFSLGQLNVILCWAVVEDVLGRRRWFTGALIGVAAGIKLVPAIFIGYFLVTRRWREAVVSVVTLAATVAVGSLVMPTSSRLYWSGLGDLQNRVASDTINGDGLAQVANQSVLGALHRLAGAEVRPLWVVSAALILVVAGIGVWGCVDPIRWSNRWWCWPWPGYWYRRSPGPITGFGSPRW